MGIRTLVIDTSGPALSVALFAGDQLIANVHDHIGRGHAEALVPAIADLPDGGRADSILVARGPGSFTGVRVGIAAARGLAFAWNARVRAFSSHALLVAGAHDCPADDVVVVTEAGHGQWFVTAGDDIGSTVAMDPGDAIAVLNSLAIGDRADAFIARRGSGVARPAFPDARDALRLSSGDLTDDLAPFYGRAPDAVAMASR